MSASDLSAGIHNCGIAGGWSAETSTFSSVAYVTVVFLWRKMFASELVTSCGHRHPIVPRPETTSCDPSKAAISKATALTPILKHARLLWGRRQYSWHGLRARFAIYPMRAFLRRPCLYCKKPSSSDVGSATILSSLAIAI